MIKSKITLIVFLAVHLFFYTAIAAAGDRFTDNGDGTVTDSELNLMWAKHDNQGNVNWKEAQRFCRLGPNRILGKYDNWRMPTIKELESLYLGDDGPAYETDCGHKVRIDPAISISCGWVWSAETKSITASVFNFHRGYVYTDRMVHYKHYRALPVRNLVDGK